MERAHAQSEGSPKGFMFKKKVSEYGQEIPQSNTAYQPTQALGGRVTAH